MIRLRRPPIPEVLQSRAQAARQALAEAAASGIAFEFKSSLYGHRQVKEALLAAQHGKCAYCEMKLDAVSYGDVEHFRPKGGFRQSATDALDSRAYYWLAYDWENLLLSCELCNQQHKRNLFPIQDPDRRALCPEDDLAAEEALIVDPYTEDPGIHLGFREAVACERTAKGSTTIACLGLNRASLEEARTELLGFIQQLLGAYRQQPDRRLRDFLYERSQPPHQFSAMVRDFLAQFDLHPPTASDQPPATAP